MSRRGVAESELFTKELINLAARGRRTPCSDAETHHLWLSDIEAERAQAAKLCRACPVILDCRAAAAARDERFGVWGGIDRTRRPASHGKAAVS